MTVLLSTRELGQLNTDMNMYSWEKGVDNMMIVIMCAAESLQPMTVNWMRCKIWWSLVSVSMLWKQKRRYLSFKT